MLTLKLINEETERVIRGLEKKHFNGAKEAIEEVMATDKKRRQAQTELDQNLSQAKKLAAEIGGLMKQGRRDEAEEVKAKVAELKEASKALEDQKAEAEAELTRQLCAIPNIPYDLVPEGAGAEDNLVVKSNLRECKPTDTVGNWDTVVDNGEAKVPHWELAKKYDLIDFDLGVKITGAGMPLRQYSYYADGKLKSVCMADGATRAYTYDEAGNLIRIESGTGYTVSYTYDCLRRKTSMEDSVGRKAAYHYDAAGRVTEHVDGLGNTDRYVYSATGKLLLAEDAVGNMAQYEYDEMDRLSVILQGEGEDTTAHTDLGYGRQCGKIYL